MTDTPMPEALGRMSKAGRISADDVLIMRRQVFTDGVVQSHEAEWLFALNDACQDCAPEWREFFVEALVDYTVNQAEPHGYVSPENADWLVDRIARSGKVETPSELELLVKTLEQARSAPDNLAGFALAQVRRGLAEGGVRVGKPEAQLLRRILYASGGAGNIAVTRAEAEALFDINDKARAADNDPAWADLFVKAIANHLLAGHGHAVPPREEALARARWLDEPSGGFFSSMASGLSGLWQGYREPDAEEASAERQLSAISSAERIDAGEAEWLASRLGRYGELRDHEMALIRFLAEESPDIDPALAPLLEKARADA